MFISNAPCTQLRAQGVVSRLKEGQLRIVGALCAQLRERERGLLEGIVQKYNESLLLGSALCTWEGLRAQSELRKLSQLILKSVLCTLLALVGSTCANQNFSKSMYKL